MKTKLTLLLLLALCYPVTRVSAQFGPTTNTTFTAATNTPTSTWFVVNFGGTTNRNLSATNLFPFINAITTDPFATASNLITSSNALTTKINATNALLVTAYGAADTVVSNGLSARVLLALTNNSAYSWTNNTGYYGNGVGLTNIGTNAFIASAWEYLLSLVSGGSATNVNFLDSTTIDHSTSGGSNTFAVIAVPAGITNAWLAAATNAAAAVTNSLNAANLSSGIIPDARMPNLTGEVTTSEGAVATTIADSVTVTGWVLGASTATTPSPGDNDASLATTEFVTAAVAAGGGNTNYIANLTSTNGYFTYVTNSWGITATFVLTNLGYLFGPENGTGQIVGTTGASVTNWSLDTPTFTGAASFVSLGVTSFYPTNMILPGLSNSVAFINSAGQVVATNFSGALAASSAATNYTVPLLLSSVNNTLFINAANTNIFVTFTGTNVMGAERTIVINALTNTLVSRLGFISTVRTNSNFNQYTTNGTAKVLHFLNVDTTGTNVLVTDGGRWSGTFTQ